MFIPPSNWKAKSPSDWPRWSDAARISVDLECCDEQLIELGPGCRREDSFIAGIGVAIDNGPSLYLPVAHHGGDNVENPDAVWKWAADNAAEFSGEYVGGNDAYDLDWLRVTYKNRRGFATKEHTVRFPKVKRFIDVLIVDCLIYELHKSGRLDAVADRWGVKGKDKTLLLEGAKAYGLKKPMQEMWKLPARYVGTYNEADLRIPLELLPKMLQMIATQKLEQIYDIECGLIPILVDMRERGVRINEKKLQDIETWSIVEEREMIKRIKELTGVDVRVDELTNSDSIGKILKSRGVAVPTDSKGKYSVDEEFLTFCPDKAAKPLLRGRQMCNLRNKFSTPTWQHLTKGRIHCVYNQVRGTEEHSLDGAEKQKGARTGRMSAEHTNMTQQPSRSDWAKRWKAIIEPEEGMFWFSNDYSQQEPRLTTHYAALLDLPKARETARAYREDELLDNHAFMAQLTGLKRKHAKNVYLGLVYSMGEAKLCRTLGLPTQFCVSYGPWGSKIERFFETRSEAMAYRAKLEEENVALFECAGPEGKEILAIFFARAPFLKALSQRAMSNGRKHGEIITLLGRHLHLPPLDNGKYDWVHKCLNMLIQGSAADQMKKAMIDVARQMPHLWLQLQVHDMLGGSCRTKEEAKEVGWIMRNAFISQFVPFRVDTGFGPNWGEEIDLCHIRECMNDSLYDDKNEALKFCEEHRPRGAT